MKKFSILALTLILAVSFAACSSSKDSVKEDAKVKTVDKKAEPVKADPKVACKADADKAFAACTTKAGKDKNAAAKCSSDKTKAYTACEPKAVPAKKK